MKKILLRSVIVLVSLILLLVIYVAYLYFDASRISKGDPIPLYGIAYSAVLVIDIQEGTTGKVSDTEYYIQKSTELIDNVNTVIMFADSLQIPVVYIRQEITNWLLNFASNNVLAEGSPGSGIDSRVKIASNNFFPKQKMDAFSNQNLSKFFLSRQITNLFVVGLDAAYCLNRTVFAAQNRGYVVYIVEDAVISETESLKDEMMQEFKSTGMNVISLDEFKVKIFESQTWFKKNN